MLTATKYTFSGHESFPCKALWLKKGYDFVSEGHNWNSTDSVVKLGVGKNMVSSIRYWMKAFALSVDNSLTDIAHFVFEGKSGCDPFIEDIGTLWLLHYLIVSSGEATLYNLFFTRFQRERITFERQQVVTFIKRCMIESGKLNAYNENTIKKDVGVLLQNYVQPQKAQSMEEFSSLLIELDLIRVAGDGKQYSYNIEGKRQLPLDILLYAVTKEKGDDNSLDYDILQHIGLMFCLNDMELISMLTSIEVLYPNCIRYSDTAGLRQIQFLKELKPIDVLKHYYYGQEF